MNLLVMCLLECMRVKIILYYMESIGCKGERVDEEVVDEFEKEEKGVDDYYNFDV